MNYGWEIIKIVFYLIIIIGVIYLLSYPIKRKISKNHSSRYMKIIDRLYYDSKSSFILLEIEDEVILIAQSESKVEKLSSWNINELDIDFSVAKLSNTDNSFDFIDYFRRFTGSNKGDKGE